MPNDVMMQILQRLTALEDALAKLQTTQRNIDTLALRDGVTAPTAVVGQAILYVDTADGDLKARFGDGFIRTIGVDS